MNGYQLQQVCLGILCVFTSGALAAHAARVRGTAARAEVAELAAAVGFVASLAFLLSGYTDKRGVDWALVPIDLLKNLPVYFTVAYACSVQARSYRVAWSRRRLRTLLKKAPYVLVVVLIVSVLLEVAWSYPNPGGNAHVPARVLLAEWLGAGSVVLFASAAAFVFFKAARMQAPGLRVSVQNIAAAAAMLLFALEAAIYATYWTAEALGPTRVIDLVSRTTLTLTVPLIALELAALFIAVVAFYGRSDTDKLAEKAVDFFDCVGRISGILDNAPVWEKGLSAPYAKLVEASGEEFLGLYPLEGRKAADAYRMAAILECRGAKDGSGNMGVGAADLHHLVRLHDEALADPEFSSWLRSVSDRRHDREMTPHNACGHREDLRTPHEPLGPLLCLGDERRRTDHPASAEHWEQLARLACAEAGLLPGGDRAVHERVRDCYELANAKLRYGIG